jgi:hypothetical protein
VLPALVVEYYQDIAKVKGREIVWQNGVLLRPINRHDAEALVRADYHKQQYKPTPEEYSVIKAHFAKKEKNPSPPNLKAPS